MLRVFRMWRFVRLVNKENKAIGYKDPIMVGFHADEKYKYVVDATVIDMFRVFSRDENKRKYIAERTLKAAVAKEYLIPHLDPPIVKLEVNPAQGDDFVSIGGLVLGMFRELKLWEQVVATVLTSSLFIGISQPLMALIDKIVK